jgi:hypothetical protein
MRRFGQVIIAIVAATVAIWAAVVSTPALAGSPALQDNPPAEARMLPYSGALPSCADPFVLGEISSGFASRESEYWASQLAIANFGEVREVGYRSNGPSYIPRRYCRAEGNFNDGLRRRVAYQIGEALGFIGVGYGVTWCVVGLDRNHAFSPHCRAAGP